MAPVRPTGAGAPAHVASVLNSLRRVVRAFRAMAQVAQEVAGISGAQLFVLQRLAASPALSLNDLAARTMTHKSSVSVVVRRLVERGLVRRRRSAADGRSIVLTLTPAGRRLIERAPESAQHRMIAALRRFPRRDLEAFAVLFGRFTDELGVTGLEPTMLFEEEPGAGRDGPPDGSRRKRTRHSTRVRGR